MHHASTESSSSLTSVDESSKHNGRLKIGTLFVQFQCFLPKCFDALHCSAAEAGWINSSIVGAVK